MLAVATQVMEKEKVAEHSICLGSVGPRVAPWNRTLTTTDEYMIVSHDHPPGRASKMIWAAIGNNCCRVSSIKGIKHVKWGAVLKLNALEEHVLPIRQGEKIPGLAKGNSMGREDAPTDTLLSAFNRNSNEW